MKFLNKIFSITNTPNKSHKVITIFGFKIKLNLEAKNRQIIQQFREKQEEKIAELRNKVKSGEKIKVAFLQQYITGNQNFSIFKAMLDDDLFDPYFIVNPDILRSDEHRIETYDRCLDELQKSYGINRVLKGWIKEEDKFIDYTNEFDIAFTSNPYDSMAYKYYKLMYWSKEKNIPMFYTPYFYWGRCIVSIDNLRNNTINYFYKIFVPNKFCKNLAEKYETIKGQNIVVSGYPKMDTLSEISKDKEGRKLVIIAPHHTIGGIYPQAGSFVEIADVLLELPKNFPHIDFVFRPHPLLKQNLLKEEYWGEEKTQEFFEAMLSYENVTYSTDGEYLQVFADSDALIHDCGSFAAEYLYTGKPCAYSYRSDLDLDKNFTEFGKKCLDSHYPLRQAQDFYDFIDNVVLQGNDTLKEKRQKFATEEVIVNHPNATGKILDEIKEIICR